VTKHHLQNYLRTHRKRARLPQRHVAFLAGATNGSKISRYENFSRIPDLVTVFTLEVIYGTPASELFAGIFEEARALVERRALEAAQGTDASLASFARWILDPSASRPAQPPAKCS
jgi:transcriptional regulator with XRE-family HTH domain